MNGNALVVGGGFFGCMLALHLRERGHGAVQLFEREHQLLGRASFINQARVHNGYHYPRSYVTAWRSRANFHRFARQFAPAVRRDFTCLYAIAARRSKVRPTQFERFLRDIGAQFERTSSAWRGLFDPRLVAAVYIAEEYAFDASRLREILQAELACAGVHLHLDSEVTRIEPSGDYVRVEVRSASGMSSVQATRVFNCTYARTNFTTRGSPAVTPLKHELAELALVEVPSGLRDLGVTLMDGPFFSCMPFPAAGLHSLSHVRYTPHGAVFDRDGSCDPLDLLGPAPPQSRAALMLADAARYLPVLRQARHHRSLYEVKTVLAEREVDDGRPILLRREFDHPGVFSILGGKLDNVYDVLQEIDRLLGLPSIGAPGLAAGTEAAA